MGFGVHFIQNVGFHLPSTNALLCSIFLVDPEHLHQWPLELHLPPTVPIAWECIALLLLAHPSTRSPSQRPRVVHDCPPATSDQPPAPSSASKIPGLAHPHLSSLFFPGDKPVLVPSLFLTSTPWLLSKPWIWSALSSSSTWLVLHPSGFSSSFLFP